MGTITILNGTNQPINSCISAGVNYSWCNKLNPNEYYQHEGAAGVYSLNSKYWLGEDSEYSNSAAEIGLFVAASIIGVIGVALIPFTGGGSAAGATALYCAIAGAATASAGTAIGAISIAANEFNNSPSTFTNIHALQNRRFIAKGGVDAEMKTGPDGIKYMQINSVTPITLHALSEAEYQALIQKDYTEYQSKPMAGSFATVAQLKASNLLDKPLLIRPANGGDCVWEIENDANNDATPLQLWNRTGKKVEWQLKPVSSADDANEFYIYNPDRDRYVTTDEKLHHHLGSSHTSGEHQSFHVVMSEHDKHECCYFFVPKKSPSLTIISESGNLGNSTKLALGPTKTINPTWALWKLENAQHG